MREAINGGRYVVVSGPPGSGKTTVARMLSSTLATQTLLENVGTNPYFADYYGQPRAWVFHLVTAFLANSLSLLPGLRESLRRGHVIQDWSFKEHFDVYALQVHVAGILSVRDLETCRLLHRTLELQAPTPDLTICLRADPKILMRRVRERDRPGESEEVLAGYLSCLAKRYDEWFPTLVGPRIELDTGSKDLLLEPEALSELTRRVSEHLTERKAF
ncbi:MAG: deoxynucleoside kinase [Fimbriimonas sp.]